MWRIIYQEIKLLLLQVSYSNFIIGSLNFSILIGVSTTRLAKRLADNLNVSLCIIHFGQIEPGKTKDEVMRTGGMKVVGDIANKVAILVDDMADNCNVQYVYTQI